jgi:hypothetical protein
MKKTKLVLTALILFTVLVVNSQTAHPQPAKSPSLKENAEKSNLSRKTKQMEQKSASTKGTPGVSNAVVINENDTYQGRREEFEKLFLSQKLPSDFPTYHSSYGIRGYNQMIDSYCAHHLDLLVAPVRQKITGHL